MSLGRPPTTNRALAHTALASAQWLDSLAWRGVAGGKEVPARLGRVPQVSEVGRQVGGAQAASVGPAEVVILPRAKANPCHLRYPERRCNVARGAVGDMNRSQIMSRLSGSPVRTGRMAS
jgi:hypothetical protein